MTIITIDDCPNCIAEKLMYPEARVVRSEDLISATYTGDDRNDLMAELQMSDGNMPLVLP